VYSNNTSGFGKSFYVANLMEIFERLAWYGFFAVSSIYMTTPKTQGGVGFSDIERGAIQGIIPFFLYLLPVLTGALGDRVGYRKMFIISFAIMAPSYFLLGQVKEFWPFFIVLSFVALGASCFKPVVVGTIAHSTNDSNRGLGFGIFYTMVNIGGFLGPLMAGAMRAISWDAVFMMSAAWVLLNFVPVLFFYKDPPSLQKIKGKSLKETINEAQSVLGNGRLALILFVSIVLLMCAGVEWLTYPQAFVAIALWLILNLVWNFFSKENATSWWQEKVKVSNPKFAIYLAILTGFWTVYNQLFYTVPLFIRDFVDTKDLVQFLSLFGQGAVDFFAFVDEEKISAAIVALFNDIKLNNAIEFETLRLEWVHLKVNVPTNELANLVTELRLIANNTDELNSTQVQNYTANLLAYRQVNPEYLINLDFAAIVILQICVSLLCQRFKSIYVLIAGLIVIASAFLFLIGAQNKMVGWVITIVILLIALGEMLTSPKSQEYVASIAPKEQAALYMGYYFVSMALGFLCAGFLSGWSYANLAIGMNKPELMWLLFAAIAGVTSIALWCFNIYSKNIAAEQVVAIRDNT